MEDPRLLGMPEGGEDEREIEIPAEDDTEVLDEEDDDEDEDDLDDYGDEDDEDLDDDEDDDIDGPE